MVRSHSKEFATKCLDGPLGRSITADGVATTLDDATLRHGVAEPINCDNGPEFVARGDWTKSRGPDRRR
jgi:hypothetical protein